MVCSNVITSRNITLRHTSLWKVTADYSMTEVLCIQTWTDFCRPLSKVSFLYIKRDISLTQTVTVSTLQASFPVSTVAWPLPLSSCKCCLTAWLVAMLDILSCVLLNHLFTIQKNLESHNLVRLANSWLLNVTFDKSIDLGLENQLCFAPSVYDQCTLHSVIHFCWTVIYVIYSSREQCGTPQIV